MNNAIWIVIVMTTFAVGLTFTICVCNLVMAALNEWEETRKLNRKLLEQAFDFKLAALTKQMNSRSKSNEVDPNSMLDDLSIVKRSAKLQSYGTHEH